MELISVEIKLIKTNGNYRKDTDPKSIAELAMSIKSSGLLQPIGLNRVDKNNYDLIYGSRRLEAFKLLEYATIPSIIYEAGDKAALQIIENLQRKDVEPLENAGARKKYKTHSNLTYEVIGTIIGKTITEVATLNRLNDLYEPISKLLKDKKIEIDVATVLAKYPIREQKEFLNQYSYKKNELRIKDVLEFFKNRNLKLKDFPFSTEKPFEKMPMCIKCPDRSSVQSVLFPDFENKDDACLNRKCLEQKIEINLSETIKEKRKLGKVIYLKMSQYGNSFGRERNTDDELIHHIKDLKHVTPVSDEDEKKAAYGIVIMSDILTDIGKEGRYLIEKKKESSSSRPSSKVKIDDLKPEEQLKRRLEIYNRKKDILTFPKHVDISKAIKKELAEVKYNSYKVIPIEALIILADYLLELMPWHLKHKMLGIYNPYKDKRALPKMFKMFVSAMIDHPDYLNPETLATDSAYKRMRALCPVFKFDLISIDKTASKKYEDKLASHRERFILKNKIDPETKKKIKNKTV